MTFTVTLGHSCELSSSFNPPNSTIAVLDQAGTTVIIPATDMTPNATGGTVTVTLPSDFAPGVYTMQFLCNSDAEQSSIFGNNEFLVNAVPPQRELNVVVRNTADVPPVGTTFVVRVRCGPPGGGPPSVDQDLTFKQEFGLPNGRLASPATGKPVMADQDDFCVVTETDDGGATSVAYPCTLSGEPDSKFCQPSGNVVQFDPTMHPQQVVNVIVDNTFIPPPSFTG